MRNAEQEAKNTQNIGRVPTGGDENGFMLGSLITLRRIGNDCSRADATSEGERATQEMTQ